MRSVVLALLAVGSLGCLERVSLGRELSAAAPDGGSPPPTWGRHLEGLSLPDCPAAPVLWVTSTDDGFDTWPLTTVAEAGASLSLPEALAIATGTPGPHTIRFDPAVFPIDAPATITLQTGADYHFTAVRQTCLDGRGSGVLVDWTAGAECPSCVFSLAQGSLMVGLTLSNLPGHLEVLDAQVAGCRLAGRFHVVELPGVATIGPDNVLSGPVGLHAMGAPALRVVRDNFFGLDPVVGEALPLDTAVVATQGLFFLNNVVRNTTVAVVADFPRSGTNVLKAEGNFFGVDRSRAPLPGNRPGTAFQLFGGTHIIDSGNVIWGADVAVHIVRDAQAIVTMNSIYGNADGIRYDLGTPVPVPVISSTDRTDGASGTCAMPGMVELYSDLGNQGEDFVGYTTCDGAQWRYRGFLPPGRNLTALLISRQTVIGTSPFSAPMFVSP